MKHTRRCLFVFVLPALIFSLLTFHVFAQENLTLRVVVDGATRNHGQAICGLFTSKESFLKKPYQSETAEIDDQGRASFKFRGLKRGTYAVSVIYDENRDGKLNTSFLGIPTERLGASNNAKGRFGPPSFKKAKFELKSEKKITIYLAGPKD